MKTIIGYHPLPMKIIKQDATYDILKCYANERPSVHTSTISNLKAFVSQKC